MQSRAIDHVHTNQTTHLLDRVVLVFFFLVQSSAAPTRLESVQERGPMERVVVGRVRIGCITAETYKDCPHACNLPSDGVSGTSRSWVLCGCQVGRHFQRTSQVTSTSTTKPKTRKRHNLILARRWDNGRLRRDGGGSPTPHAPT